MPRKGVDEPRSPGWRLWLGHSTNSRAVSLCRQWDPLMENKSGVESWCISCQSSPRGCGKLGFLHILMLLKIWHGGAFLSSGEPPALLLGPGAPLRGAVSSVLAGGAGSRCAPTQRHASHFADC